MRILRFFITILLCTCLACDESDKHAKEPKLSSQFIQVNFDSIFHEIEKDSNNQHRYVQYKQLLDHSIDSPSIESQIAFKIFQCDTSTELSKYQILQKIIGHETSLKQSKQGTALLANAYRQLVRLNKQQGDFDLVVDNCERYLLYSNPSLDSTCKAPVLTDLGDAYHRLGDLKKAIATLELACQFAIQLKNANMHAYAASALANCYAMNNELSKALSMIEQGLSFPGISDEDRIWFLMMKVPYMEDDQNKIKVLKNILALTNSSGTKFFSYKTLTDTYIESHDYKNALSVAHQSILIQDMESREIAKQYLSIGKIYEALGFNDSATYAFDTGLKKLTDVEVIEHQTIPVFDRMYPENTIYDLLIAKADLLIHTHAIDSVSMKPVLICLNAAKRVSDLLRKELVFDESKFEMAGDLKMVSERLITLNYKLYERYHLEQYAENAFMVAENSKAVALQENTERDILLRSETDTNYAKFIELRKKMNEVEIALKNTTDIHVQDSLHQSLNQLISLIGIYKSLSNAMLPANEREYSYKELLHYLNQQHLSGLSYFIAEHDLFMFFVDPQNQTLQFKRCDLSIIDSINLLTHLQQKANVFNQQKDQFIRLSNQLYQTIFKVLVPSSISNNKKIVIFADGPLNNLAFDAFITDPNKLNSFLLNQYNMSCGYSIRSMILQQERSRNINDHMLVFAPFVNQSIRNLAALPNSLKEVDWLKSNYHATCRVNQEGRFNQFQQDLQQYRFLHFATHASTEETPSLEFYDSSIQVNSIYQIPMNQDLVYLNTCQSGAGATIFSEGNLSLARAFYSNGIHNIISTYWNMNDASSAELSQLFYKNLHTSNNSIDALHQAKLDYLSTHPMDQQAPYYWASLQLIGDGRIESSTNYSDWWKWGIALFVTALVLFFFKKYRN